MRFWPRRSKDEKTEDIYQALFELAVSLGLLSLGLVCLWFSGAVLGGSSWVFGIGIVLAILGVYAVMQTAFALLIEVSVGMAGAMVVLGFVILGFMIYQGYGILTE